MDIFHDADIFVGFAAMLRMNQHVVPVPFLVGMLELAAPLHRFAFGNRLVGDALERFMIIRMHDTQQRCAIKTLVVEAGDDVEVAREIGATGLRVEQA